MPDEKQYDDATLLKMLKDEGVNWGAMEQEYEKHMSQFKGQGKGKGNVTAWVPSLPGPAAIVGAAIEIGFHIPWDKVVRFLVCVAKGVMSQSLPAAVKECAGKWGEPKDAGEKK